MKHVFLIDGSGFIFRAYFGLPAMNRADGTPVGAVYGFTNMLLKLVEDTDADHIAVVFDVARKTFRNDIYPQYKANRDAPPDDLIPQFDLVREATRAMNLPVVEAAGFEADDLIATYAKEAAAKGAEVTIVSSDKDLMQLVSDQVTMLDAMKNKVIGPPQVIEKFGVGPDRVVDVQALAGDSSDNVPGVQGIGIKTGAQLINEYGDLDTLLARAGEIKQPKRREKLLEQADMARTSRELVRLRDDVPMPMPLEDLAVKEINPVALLSFLHEQSFKSLISRFESRHPDAADAGREAGKEATSRQAGKKTTDKKPEPNKKTSKAEKLVAPMGSDNSPPLGQGDYDLVDTVAALEVWIAGARERGIVAVDTETTGLDAQAAGLVGISLAYEPGRACYIPLAHLEAAEQGAFDLGDGGATKKENETDLKQIPIKTATKILKPLLEDDAVLKVGQNIKYDMGILVRHGIHVAPVDDTMVLSYVLEGGLHGHGMDELSKLHFGYQPITFKEVAGTGKAQVTFDHVALEAARDYAAEDADVTLRLHHALKPRLVPERMTTVYETFERPLIPVLAAMEGEGIAVDAKELKSLSDDFAKRLGDLETDIHKLAGRAFNVASPKQLGEILFDEMKIEGGKKSKKTGAYVTDAEVLDDLAAAGHELPAHVLSWRQLAKLKSTYTDALIAQINPETGRVHTSFSMAATSTGRLASSDPNLQNIPIRTEEGRKIRKAFIAEAGNVLLSADYSQIELRLLAHVADIGVLKDAFRDGQDIHAITASGVFGVPVEGMDPMVRRQAKAINFGIIYGISAFGLARQLGIDRGEAQRYIEAYFAKYPGIRDYMEETKSFARENGFVMTPFGRKCHVRGIEEKGARGNFAERAAINAPIQGGAADIIKRAMVQMPAALKAAKSKARLLLQVHDELIFEVPKKEADKTEAVIRGVMEGAASLSVPLTVDVGRGKNWDDAH